MKGMTLIELIASLTLLILLLAVGVPGFFDLADKYRTKTSISNFTKTLRKTRWMALNRAQEITICPLDHQTCSRDWNSKLTVFTDLNRNNKVDNQEEIHFVTDQSSNTGYWKKRDNIEESIRFTPEGYAFAYASTWIYCPNSKNYSLSQQVVINLQGRIRTAPYLSRSGSPYASLKDLTCP